MKKIINNILHQFGVELNGVNYMQKLRAADRKNEFDVFRKYFKSNIVIYDGGANRGTTVEKFRDAFKESQIHAFEPFETMSALLQQKFATDEKVRINQSALNEFCGQRILHVNHNPDTNSLLQTSKTGLNSDKQAATLTQTTVNTITLDSYAHNNNHKRIHILKLDIQGSELNALKGASELLRSGSIDIIFCEAYFIQQYSDQPLFFEIAAYLSQFEYHLQDLYNLYYGNGSLAWCDALFIRKGLNKA